MMLPVGVVSCIPGQYRAFPPLAAIIAAIGVVTRHRRRSTGISGHLAAGLGTKILGRVIHTADCMAQFIPNMFYGVAVWLSCRLFNEIKDYPSTVMCGVTVLVAVVIHEVLPGKWL